MAVEENFCQRRVSFCLRVHAEQNEKRERFHRKGMKVKNKRQNRKQNTENKTSLIRNSKNSSKEMADRAIQKLTKILALSSYILLLNL